MGRSCIVCTHTARAFIEQEMSEGRKNRDIASKYGLSPAGLSRHKRGHMTREGAEALALMRQDLLPLPPNLSLEKQERLARHINAADELLDLRDKAREIYETASGKDPQRTKLAAVGELRAIVETMAKLSVLAMERGEGASEGGDEGPPWSRVKEGLLDVIREHPEARAAIISAIERIEHGCRVA